MNCYIEKYGYNSLIPKRHSTETHTLLAVNNGSLNGYCQGKQLVSPENLSDLSKCNPECISNCAQYCLKPAGHLNSEEDCNLNCSDFCADHHQDPSSGDSNGAKEATYCATGINTDQGISCGQNINNCCQQQCKGDQNCFNGCMNKLVNCCAYPACRFNSYCTNCNSPSPGGGGGGTPQPNPQPKPSPGGGGDSPTQQQAGFFNTTGGKITLWTGIVILALLAILAVITTIMKHRKKSISQIYYG